MIRFSLTFPVFTHFSCWPQNVSICSKRRNRKYFENQAKYGLLKKKKGKKAKTIDHIN